jgi:molybdenum cofactor biosynthesis protein B
MSHTEHRATSPATVRCAVLVVSDTRTRETDTSGAAVAELVAAGGHTLHERVILPDDPEAVRRQVEAWIAFPGVDVVITTGGTGLTARDSTCEAIAGLIEKPIDGFGELFRMLSYHEIGPAAMLTRAFAGAVRGTILIALPGSESAVRLAMTKLVVPELGHLVREARR